MLQSDPSDKLSKFNNVDPFTLTNPYSHKEIQLLDKLRLSRDSGSSVSASIRYNDFSRSNWTVVAGRDPPDIGKLISSTQEDAMDQNKGYNPDSKLLSQLSSGEIFLLAKRCIHNGDVIGLAQILKSYGGPSSYNIAMIMDDTVHGTKRTLLHECALVQGEIEVPSNLKEISSKSDSESDWIYDSLRDQLLARFRQSKLVKDDVHLRGDDTKTRERRRFLFGSLRSLNRFSRMNYWKSGKSNRQSKSNKSNFNQRRKLDQYYVQNQIKGTKKIDWSFRRWIQKLRKKKEDQDQEVEDYLSNVFSTKEKVLDAIELINDRSAARVVCAKMIMNTFIAQGLPYWRGSMYDNNIGSTSTVTVTSMSKTRYNKINKKNLDIDGKYDIGQSNIQKFNPKKYQNELQDQFFPDRQDASRSKTSLSHNGNHDDSDKSKHTTGTISFIDKRDINGDTALHLAAQNGHIRLVKLLLLYGSRAGDENYTLYQSKHWGSRWSWIGHILDESEFAVIQGNKKVIRRIRNAIVGAIKQKMRKIRNSNGNSNSFLKNSLAYLQNLIDQFRLPDEDQLLFRENLLVLRLCSNFFINLTTSLKQKIQKMSKRFIRQVLGAQTSPIAMARRCGHMGVANFLKDWQSITGHCPFGPRERFERVRDLILTKNQGNGHDNNSVFKSKNKIITVTGPGNKSQLNKSKTLTRFASSDALVSKFQPKRNTNNLNYIPNNLDQQHSDFLVGQRIRLRLYPKTLEFDSDLIYLAVYRRRDWEKAKTYYWFLEDNLGGKSVDYNFDKSGDTDSEDSQYQIHQGPEDEDPNITKDLENQMIVLAKQKGTYTTSKDLDIDSDSILFDTDYLNQKKFVKSKSVPSSPTNKNINIAKSQSKSQTKLNQKQNELTWLHKTPANDPHHLYKNTPQQALFRDDTRFPNFQGKNTPQQALFRDDARFPNFQGSKNIADLNNSDSQLRSYRMKTDVADFSFENDEHRFSSFGEDTFHGNCLARDSYKNRDTNRLAQVSESKWLKSSHLEAIRSCDNLSDQILQNDDFVSKSRQRQKKLQQTKSEDSILLNSKNSSSSCSQSCDSSGESDVKDKINHHFYTNSSLALNQSQSTKSADDTIIGVTKKTQGQSQKSRSRSRIFASLGIKKKFNKNGISISNSGGISNTNYMINSEGIHSALPIEKVPYNQTKEYFARPPTPDNLLVPRPYRGSSYDQTVNQANFSSSCRFIDDEYQPNAIDDRRALQNRLMQNNTFNTLPERYGIAKIQNVQTYDENQLAIANYGQDDKVVKDKAAVSSKKQRSEYFNRYPRRTLHDAPERQQDIYYSHKTGINIAEGRVIKYFPPVRNLVEWRRRGFNRSKEQVYDIDNSDKNYCNSSINNGSHGKTVTNSRLGHRLFKLFNVKKLYTRVFKGSTQTRNSKKSKYSRISNRSYYYPVFRQTTPLWEIEIDRGCTIKLDLRRIEYEKIDEEEPSLVGLRNWMEGTQSPR